MKEETERRVMICMVIAVMFGALVFLICMGSDHWVVVEIPNGIYRNESQAYVMGHYSGLWKICRWEMDNQTNIVIHRTYCRMLRFFATEELANTDPELDSGILHYSRSETAFAVISLLLLLLAVLGMLYALKEPRYMFKRLAAVLNLMAGICILVCLEVFITSVNYEKENLPARLPPNSHIHYDWSFGLAWVPFAIQVVATVVFIFFGRKRKGDKARNQDEAMENEPVILGRI